MARRDYTLSNRYIAVEFLKICVTIMAAFRVSALWLSRKASTICRPQLCLGVHGTARLQQSLQRNSHGYAKYSTATTGKPSLAPKIERGGSKLFKNADEAVADLKSGSTILSSGFGLCGVAGISLYGN